MNVIEVVTQNEFPREIGIRTSLGFKRFVVTSPEEVLEYTRRYNYVGDIYLGVHAIRDLVEGIVRRMYFDFDCEQDLNLAKEDALKVYNFFDAKRVLVFSGNKGYHVHVFFEPVKLSNPSNTLREYVRRLSADLGLKTLDMEPSYNMRGLARLPGTFNIKGKQFCQIVEVGDGGRGEGISAQLKEIDELLDERAKEAPIEVPHEDYGVISDVLVKARIEFRGEVAKLAERAQRMDLSHEERLILLFEAINVGWSDEEILELFKHQSDFNPKVTLYMIGHARQRGYKPYARRKIREIVGEV